MYCLDQQGRRMDEEGRRYRPWDSTLVTLLPTQIEGGLEPRKVYAALASSPCRTICTFGE